MEVVAKEKNLTCHLFWAFLNRKKQVAHLSAIPELGIIPGIDWDPQGIG